MSVCYSAAPSWRPLETPKLFTTTTPVASGSSSSSTSPRAGTSREAACLTVSFCVVCHLTRPQEAVESPGPIRGPGGCTTKLD